MSQIQPVNLRDKLSLFDSYWDVSRPRLLWAVMVFIAIGVLGADWPSIRVALVALLVAYAVEVSQLYHAPWIDGLRNTRPGALVLGYGFLWSDITCYTTGVALCVAIESLAGRRSNICQ